ESTYSRRRLTVTSPCRHSTTVLPTKRAKNEGDDPHGGEPMPVHQANLNVESRRLRDLPHARLRRARRTIRALNSREGHDGEGSCQRFAAGDRVGGWTEGQPPDLVAGG